VTSNDVGDKFRTREIDRTDPIRTLLNSLTLESIREAAYQLAPTKKVRIRSHASSHEDLLQVGKPNDAIIQALLDAEARTPFKHVLVAHALEPARAQEVKTKIRQSTSAGGFDFLLRHSMSVGDFVYLTLEHSVTVKEWIEGDAADIRKLESYETRHPVVVRVSVSTGIVLICYPGFTQGTGTKRTALIGYGELLTAVVSALATLGLDTQALPIRESLKVLMAGSNRRVYRVRADIEAANVGRFDLSSLKQDKTIEESLADLILPHLGGAASRELFIDSAKRAINDTEANFLVLYWVEEAVITRLKFWDIGCEMFFTWHGERASYRAIDSVLQLLIETQAKLTQNADEEHGTTLAWLSGRKGGEVVRPSTFAETFKVTASTARQELVYAVKAGLLVPVFRLNTNQLVEGTLNNWVDDPSTLRRVWMLDDGSELDGASPANVEVAFRRVMTAEGQQ